MLICNATIETRDYKYDNMRLLLIFGVIMGHGLELIPNKYTSELYYLLYSFHMPAFLFVTGKFAKFNLKRIVRHFLLPYFVFQTAYLCFKAIILSNDGIILQYSTPYWLLWYLLSITYYHFLIPILPSKNTSSIQKIYFLLTCSVMVSLLVGYAANIGYFMSLSRTLVFAPFFIWGYYSNDISEHLSNLMPKNINVYFKIGTILFLICGGEYFLHLRNVPITLLYGSYSYPACGSGIVERSVALVTAAACVGLLNMLVPGKRLPLITSLGQRTMPVFLFHGFFIRIIGKYEVLHYPTIINLLLLTLFAILIIALFGNKYFDRLFSNIF